MTVIENRYMEAIATYLPKIATSLNKIEQHLDLIKDAELSKLEVQTKDE